MSSGSGHIIDLGGLSFLSLFESISLKDLKLQ